MTNMQVQLPDEIADAIKRQGLLTSEGLAELLREGLRSKALEAIRRFAAETTARGIPEMTAEEIQREIDEARRETKG